MSESFYVRFVIVAQAMQEEKKVRVLPILASLMSSPPLILVGQEVGGGGKVERKRIIHVPKLLSSTRSFRMILKQRIFSL